jgi:sterol 3beta-glucosyltransferase
VGTVPILHKKLTVELQAIVVVASPSENRVVIDRFMRQRAANLGAKIQTDDGIASEVAVVDSYSTKS